MTGIQGPRIRQRFVTSARYWRDDPEFLEARALAIQHWNEWVRGLGFPEYSITPRRFRAADSWKPDELTPLPAELALKLERMNRRHAQTRKIWPDDWKIFKAFTMWEVLVAELCNRYWPAEYFPNWTGTARSPATGFVAACLLADPCHVEPDSWMPKLGIAPQPVRFDFMLDYYFHPARWYERRWQYLWQEGLRQLQEAGYPPTDEYQAAAAEWATEQAAAWLPRHSPAPGEPTAALLFYPGTSSKDYQDAGPAVSRLFAQDHLDAVLRAEALRLKSEGVKVTAIAGRLGFSDRQIHRFLERVP